MKHALACLSLMLLALLAACAPIQTPEALPAPAAILAPTVTPAAPQPAPPVGLDGQLVQGTAGQPWWNDTVFYEIFVRSFSDSNGDGVGDLNGLIQKLDYLNDGDPATTTDLGVTGIWLMPIAESPSYHGYDVSDYTQVDREYGTNADFKRLIAEAHRRGIRVIVDLVLNHTSSQHPWFTAAQDPASPKRDWYIWSKEQPQGPGWHKGKDGWYYGYFWEGMPDLNYRNEAVTAAMHDAARFWLEEMGADGFRLDAVKYLIEDGRRIENTPATHDWLEDFRTFYKGVQPDALTVGEVWSTSDVSASYVGDELDLAFDFPLADATIASALNGRSLDAQRAQKAVLAAYPAGQYATFLANHDQNRTRSRLIDDDQARMAATLQLLFSGVPFVYYGEEIGMSGTKPDENHPAAHAVDGRRRFHVGQAVAGLFRGLRAAQRRSADARSQIAAESLPRADPPAQQPRGAEDRPAVADRVRSPRDLCRAARQREPDRAGAAQPEQQAGGRLQPEPGGRPAEGRHASPAALRRGRCSAAPAERCRRLRRLSADDRLAGLLRAGGAACAVATADAPSVTSAATSKLTKMTDNAQRVIIAPDCLMAMCERPA